MDFSEITDDLDGIQEKIDKYADQLSDYIEFIRDIQQYIYKSKGLKSRFGEFERQNLETTLEEEGFGPLLMSIGLTIEGVAHDVTEIMSNNSLKGKDIEVTNSLRDPATYLDRFSGNPHRGYKNPYEVGALYYMMQLTNQTAERMVDANDPTQNMILTDTNGDAYPDDKICVTRTCFENQQEEFEDGYGAYLPLVLAPLAIVALVALCNFGCLFVPAKSGGCCRRCMPHWLLCLLIVMIPWYLIFSGFIFAFFIALSDSCTAGPKIAGNYITAYGDSLCDVLGGNGTLRECNFKGNDLDISMDLKRMSDMVLGLEKCSGVDGDDPFYIPLNALAEQIRNASQERTLREVNKDSYDKYRQPVKKIVLDFSDGSSLVVRDFLNDVGSDVITCANMQDVIEYMTAPVCYSVVGPWSWMLATIYLAAWSMCCLGIPAGCMLKHHFNWDETEFQRTKGVILDGGDGAGDAPSAESPTERIHEGGIVTEDADEDVEMVERGAMSTLADTYPQAGNSPGWYERPQPSESMYSSVPQTYTDGSEEGNAGGDMLGSNSNRAPYMKMSSTASKDAEKYRAQYAESSEGSEEEEGEEESGSSSDPGSVRSSENVVVHMSNSEYERLQNEENI